MRGYGEADVFDSKELTKSDREDLDKCGDTARPSVRGQAADAPVPRQLRSSCPYLFFALRGQAADAPVPRW